MIGESGRPERCEPDWRRKEKVPNWFIWLGRESYWLIKDRGGVR